MNQGKRVKYWAQKIAVRIPGYLLDNEQRLYQTSTDRGQLSDISSRNSEILARMKVSRELFEREYLSGFSEKDNRPFVIGHPQEYSSKLPARDAKIKGAIERSNRFPNCSFFTNWRSTEARITWDVKVEKSGTFEAIIYYTCDAQNVGSEIKLGTTQEDESLVYRLTEVNDTPMLGADLDRVPREELYVKGFEPYAMGTIQLDKGRTDLILQATSIANEEVMNFWLLELKRVQ